MRRRWRGLRARWHDSADAAGADTRWRPVPSIDLAHVRSSWPRARSLPMAQHGGQRWRHDPSCCWVKVTGVTETTHVRGEVACFRKRSSFLTGAMVASSMAPGRWHQLASTARQCVSPCPYLVLFRECVESDANECGELTAKQINPGPHQALALNPSPSLSAAHGRSGEMAARKPGFWQGRGMPRAW